jgi:membrane protein DedA with SNARE-associated domain
MSVVAGAVAAVTGLLTTSPLLVLAPAMLVEGPVATVVAGTMVGVGLLGWWPAWAAAVAADLVADSLLYLVGRCGSGSRGARVLRRLGLSDARRDLWRDKVVQHLPRVVLGAKLVDVGAVPAFLSAGLAGVGYRRFLLWNAPATAVRAAVLLGLGAAAGTQLADTVRSEPWLIALAGLALGLSLLAVHAVVTRIAARRGAPA